MVPQRQKVAQCQRHRKNPEGGASPWMGDVSPGRAVGAFGPRGLQATRPQGAGGLFINDFLSQACPVRSKLRVPLLFSDIQACLGSTRLCFSSVMLSCILHIRGEKKIARVSILTADLCETLLDISRLDSRTGNLPRNLSTPQVGLWMGELFPPTVSSFVRFP